MKLNILEAQPAHGGDMATFEIKYKVGILVAAAFSVVTAGCKTFNASPSQLTRVESQRQAGVTDVAVIYVEPWDSVAQTLTPNFDISAESALKQVIPNTSDEVNRFLDAINGRFGLGLPGTTFQREKVEVDKIGEVPTSQTTTTHKTLPGSAPDVSNVSAGGDRSAKSLLGTDMLGKDLAQEPLLKYKAALALYQEVKMLNRYVQGAARGSNYTPYLVRLQVALMPYARNLPYDSYTNISFFTNAAGPAGVHPQPDKTVQSQAGAASQAQQIPTKRRLPVVIPLVVTDALEGSLSSTTTEVLRQLALGLSGTISNIGVKADSQALQDALRSISGVALNSLQTISRLGENGLRVRLGAVKSPIATDAYVMVPRTHNVTLLLLVPDEFVAGNNGIPTIEMAARSHFYDANLGSRLATFDTANSLASELADVATLYLGHVPQKKFEIPAGCRTKQYSGGDDSKPEYGKDDLLRYLIEQNQRGDIDCFGQALQQHTGIQEGGFLWNELSVLANSYGFAGTTFQLPKPPEIVPPPNQVVLLTDDGKTSTTALLRGGVSLSSERMFGSLVISDNKGNIRYELPATSISGSAPALRMTFPSLAALGITDKGAFSNGDMGVIKLWQRTDSWKRTGKDYDFAPTGTATITAGSYPVSLQKQTSPAKAGFQLETAIVAVPVKSDNTAQVSIYMTFAAATQARVTVSGAELRQASLPDSKGQPGAQMSITGGSFVVSPPGGKTDSRMEVILSLGNVIDSGTIKIAASDLNTKDAPVSEKEIKAVLMKDDQSKGAAK